MNTSSLKAKHQRDLAQLTRSKYGKGTLILALLLLLTVAGGALYFTNLDGNPRDIYQLTKANPKIRSFVYQADQFSSWTNSFAFGFESKAFTSIKYKVYLSVMQLTGEIPSSLILYFHKGILQLLFFLIASWKLWVIAGLVAIVHQRKALKPHEGDDFLANSGNGRVYYSGIRVGLDSINPDGSLKGQLTGLACPQMAAVKEVEASELFKVCMHFGALNDTNADLIAVILAHKDYPAFLSNSDTFLKLSDFALAALNVAFTLKQAFEGDDLQQEIDSGDVQPQAPALLADSVGELGAKYSSKLSVSFERALLKEMKRVIASVSAQELGTLILSTAAGRALVYSMDHGSWTSHSQYPELSARAVLFSIPSFDKDYDHEARTRLRQALMYAQRTTAFGPVRFSEAMGIDIQALRQWSELLFTEPDKLEAVANEIELYSISWYYFWRFHSAFNRELEKADSILAKEIIMTDTEVGFVPMTSVLPVLRSVTPRVIRKRLLELSEQVGLAQDSMHKADGNNERPDYERVFRPLSKEEVTELSELHAVKGHDLEEWASFRALLNLYGSLVRKVGFSVVPEHSLVGSVAVDEQGYLHSRLGDVALRVGHLVAGDNFVPGIKASRVNIAHSKEEYERLIGNRGVVSQEATNG